jgi:hypothetical protein
MIAYNQNGLYNRYVRKQAAEARPIITDEEFERIVEAHEVSFYTPNFFVKVGLGFVTSIILGSLFALTMLLFSSHESFQLSILLTGIIAIAGAEYFIHQKKHYNSGVDNVLIWAGAYCLWAAISWDMYAYANGGNYSTSPAAFIICLLFALRYADVVLSAFSALALLGLVINLCWGPLGSLSGSIVVNVAVFLVSGLMYAVVMWAMKQVQALHYRVCLVAMRVVALCGFYAAFLSPLTNGQYPAKPSWYVWVWIFTVPVAYIIAGVRKRDIVFIRTAVPLIAVSVFMFRTYYHVIPKETAMLLGGTLISVLAYLVINRLKTPRGGFTFQPERKDPDAPKMDRVITNEIIERTAGR